MLNRLLLVLLALSLSQASVDECVPKQLYSGLGSSYYYVSQLIEGSNLEDNDAIIIFTTKSECPDTVLELTDPVQKNVTIRPWEVVHFTANYTDGLYHNFIHVFYLFNLMQGEEYTYRAVSSSGNSSNTNYLKLPIAVGSNITSKADSYLVVGDWDFGDGIVTAATWNALRALINETTYKDFSHIVFMGDMAYDLEDHAGLVGDEYMEQLSASIARYLPFMTIPGNHETAYNYSNYNNRIRSPLWEETSNHYYSYNTGFIHWVTFDLDFYSMNPELVPSMLKWLAEDLKTANENRDRWPWIVFLNHRPLYCSHLLDADCNDNVNKYSQVETLLYENSVDLYLSGHVHSYERTLPIYRNEVAQFDTRTLDTRYEQIVNPQAPIHILEGIGGGTKIGELPRYNPLDFSVVVDFDLGFGTLHCHNKTHLEYIHYRSQDSKIVDRMVVVKDRIRYSHDLIE